MTALAAREQRALHSIRRPRSAPGCAAEISADAFLCKRHWGVISSRLQVRVIAAWSQRKAHPHDPTIATAHEAAKADALAFLAGPRAGGAA